MAHFEATAKPHDLGHGWTAKHLSDGGMCIQNEKKCEIIDLPPASVETLRSIIRKAGV